MKESLVQWTLLNNENYLEKRLQFPFSRKVGQEISTDFGRIDFILENTNQQQLIVELETVLNTSNKLNYCFNQILNYKNVRFTDDTSYCILYADETPYSNRIQIENFGREHEIIIRQYSLNSIKQIYSQTVHRLSLNVGLALPNPKNYTICYLRWLNKILKPFKDFGKNTLSFEDINSSFTGRTNFNCYKRLALDFEMFEEKENKFFLTNNGIEYINNFNPYINHADNVATIDLTNEQKRLLLKILTNGNWEDKIHKTNIYWFMRFVEVTDGNWLPKSIPFDNDKLEIARGLFKVSYNHRTMKEFLNWCSNYCEELGLIDRIKSTTEYDKIILTPLGVEVNNIFSMDLTLKKNRMNLSFKFTN
ncbi:MAG: hypothetical protein PWQ09_619 [Candidatus Cloacimonadota bacterium]|nr:hypothetical protein [Candidatus Cloacimonadota bacterium]